MIQRHQAQKPAKAAARGLGGRARASDLAFRIVFGVRVQHLGWQVLGFTAVYGFVFKKGIVGILGFSVDGMEMQIEKDVDNDMETWCFLGP